MNVFYRSIIVIFVISIVSIIACTSDAVAEQIRLGDNYMQEKNWSVAIVQYEKALALSPNSENIKTKLSTAYNNRGWDNNKQKNWDNAIEDFNKSLNYNPNLAIAYNNRGFAYSSKGQARLDYAYELINVNGDKKAAVKELEKSVEFYGLGISDLQKAVTLDSGLKEAAKNLANSYNDRGHVYNLLREWDKAISDFNWAIKLNSKLVEAYNNRCWAYNGKMEWEKAIPDCSMSLKMDPKMALAYNNRGWAYHEINEYEKALSDLNKAIELSPNLSVAYLNRGITYYYLNQTDRAIADFKKVLELTKDPDQVWAAKQGLDLVGASKL